MANRQGTQVSAPIVTVSDLDTFPTHFANDGQGGHHQDATLADRESMPAERQVLGKLCTVTDDGTGTMRTYRLRAGGVWEELQSLSRGRTIEAVAGEVLGGEKIVFLAADGMVYLASASTTEAGTVLGVTTHAAELGAPVEVCQEGELPTSGLFTGKRYFLGEAGAWAMVPPQTGLLQEIGKALSETKLMVGLGLPFVR